MAEKKRLKFSDFEGLIDQWMCDLHDAEILFHNQTQGMNNLLPAVLATKEKAESLADRLNYLKNSQNHIYLELNYIERVQNQMEMLLDPLTELNCGCLHQNEVVLDATRSEMYGKCETIFVDLKNCYEQGENLSIKIAENNGAGEKDPFYTLFQVINMNLSVMEKLWVRAEKLQDNLKLIERLKIQLHRYCSG